MARPIPEGYELLTGRSSKNARAAIELAEERGLPTESVLTRGDGYLVPLSADANTAVAAPPASPEEAAAARGEQQSVDVEHIEPPKATDSNEEIDGWVEKHLKGFEYPAGTSNRKEKVEAIEAEIERYKALQEAEDEAAAAEGRDRVLLPYTPESKEN